MASARISASWESFSMRSTTSMGHEDDAAGEGENGGPAFAIGELKAEIDFAGIGNGQVQLVRGDELVADGVEAVLHLLVGPRRNLLWIGPDADGDGDGILPCVGRHSGGIVVGLCAHSIFAIRDEVLGEPCRSCDEDAAGSGPGVVFDPDVGHDVGEGVEGLVEGDGGFRGDEDGVAVSAELNRAAGDVGLGDGIDDGEAGDIGVRERLEFEAVGGDGVEGLFLMAVDVDLPGRGREGSEASRRCRRHRRELAASIGAAEDADAVDVEIGAGDDAGDVAGECWDCLVILRKRDGRDTQKQKC